MNYSVNSSKNNRLPIIFAFLFSLFVFLGMQGCSSSSPGAPVVTFSDVSVVEGNSGNVQLIFSASINKPTADVVSVTYATDDVSALAGSDYVSASGTIDIPAGSTSAEIIVTVNSDTDIESDETLTLNLSTPVGVSLAKTSLTGTITNDDHANPSAYYTGTASVINPNNIATTVDLNDLHVMVSGNRIMMMNTVVGDGDSTILYDAQNVVVNGNDFTADVTIYINMHLDSVPAPILTTITGTITENARIEGVIGVANDTGAATGTFTANFSSLSDSPSDSVNIAKTWNSVINGRANMTVEYSFDTVGVINVGLFKEPIFGIFSACRFTGTVLPIASESLYSINLDLNNCDDAISNGNYTGFAIPTSVANDSLAFAFSNGTESGISILTVVP